MYHYSVKRSFAVNLFTSLILKRSFKTLQLPRHACIPGMSIVLTRLGAKKVCNCQHQQEEAIYNILNAVKNVNIVDSAIANTFQKEGQQ